MQLKKVHNCKYITVASTGNMTDFGDLTVARGQNQGTSSSTRGVYIGGRSPGASNIIDYITIASTSDAADTQLHNIWWYSHDRWRKC